MCIVESRSGRISTCALKIVAHTEDSAVIYYTLQAEEQEEVLGLYLVTVDEIDNNGQFINCMLLDEGIRDFIRFDTTKLHGNLICRMQPNTNYRISVVFFVETERSREKNIITADYFFAPSVEKC